MSTEFFNDQWRIPSNENQNKVSNYSMEFDGSGSDIIDIGSQTFNPDHSISFWINSVVSGPNSYGGILAGGANSISIDQGGGVIGVGKIYFRISSVNYTVSSTIVSETWNHVVFTRNGTNVKCYINGVLDKTTTVPVYSTWQYIGAQLASGNNPFNGKLDQLTIFDYELPATGTNSVATLYGGGTAVTNPMAISPKPIAYYQLGDQDAFNGANYLVPNNSLQDYVFSFNGNNNFINAGSASYLNGLSEFSISVWINLATAANNNTIVSDWNYNSSPFGHFAFNTTNASGANYALRLFIKATNDSGSNYVDTPATLNANTWHNAIFSYNSGTVTCYFNGSPVALTTSGTIPTTLTSQDGNLLIGDFAPLNRFWNGSLSNIALWNTELTQANATKIYNNGAPNDISSLNPINWYKLNAEDVFAYPNWIIIDSAGSNNGASVGMTSANLVQSNLQLGVGYSPYALELDGASNYFSCGSELGNSLGNAVTNFTLSGWYTAQGGASNEGLFGLSDASGNNKFSLVQSNYARRSVFFNNGAIQRSFDYDSRNQWANFVIVVSGNGSSPLTIKYYHDGTELSISSSSGTLPNSIDFSGNNAYIGNAYPLTKFFNGDVSNFSFFNFSLTSAQVTELNNNQRTANLNNLSFAKPLAWWELGSNSSFNSTTNTWTALNQGTSTGGNAISTANMTNDNIINGVGYSANGLGNSSIDIVGDAPYSTANGLSENMDVLDRTTDVPS